MAFLTLAAVYVAGYEDLDKKGLLVERLDTKSNCGLDVDPGDT